MLIGFLDDTELVLDPEDSSPDVFAIGGYFIRLEQLNDFQNRIQQVKDGYGFPPHTPVKWNLKDTGIKRFCTGDRWLSEDVTDRLLQYSFNIRRDLLSLIGEFDARIFISARYDHHWREATHAEFYGWAFENLLQRVGLMFQRQDLRARENSSTILVMDWPQNEVGKDFFDLYQGGYHFGYGLATHQNYFSGRLSDFHLLVENANQEYEVVKEQENPQLAIWLERLALPELCQEERLEIVDHIKYALSLNLTRQHAPPIRLAITV